MYWFLEERLARELEQAKRNFVPTAAQIEAFEKLQAAALAGEPPRNYRTAGNGAEIVVEGVVTKRRELFYYSYYYGGCTYDDIRASLALAESDPNIKSVVLKIDTPGGLCEGLLETIKAIEAFSKPIVARCAKACSAGYALAAACDRIEALNEASEFGCLGIVTTAYFYENETEVSITNTESPQKRLDPRTPEGRAAITKWLDATYAWFVDAIARGRSAAGKAVTVDDVNANYGRGATLTAPDAKKRGMLDGFASQPAVTPQGRARAQGNAGDSPDNDNPARAGQENDTMNKKLLALALGITESATDEAFEAAAAQQASELKDAKAEASTAKAGLAKIEALTGKTGEEAHGVVLAWKSSHEELPKVSAKLAKLEADAEAGQLDSAIAKAKAESRHTPAREAEVRKLLADKDLTVAGAKAMVGTWGVVKAIAGGNDGASAAGGDANAGDAAALTWNGKTYAEMSGAEREKLASENRDLFNQMRDGHKAAAKKS